MAKELQMQYEYQMGPEKKYSTEYTWTLNDWSLLYDSKYKRGVTSTNFNINGTDGYTCKFSLNPTRPEQSLTVEFSNTLGIEAMKVTYHVKNTWVQTTYYSQPISKTYMYNLKQSINKDSSDYILKNSSNDALVIVVTITIVKLSDTINCSNQMMMPLKMVQKSDAPPPNILGNFKTMFDRKAFCDVTFVLGEKTFSAHKAVLAAQSKVFEAMFLSGMKEQKDNNIEISDTDAEVFQAFLNYLYSGEMTNLDNIVEEMIVIADFYHVSHLKAMCENLMLKSLSEDLVVRYAILADKLNCNALKTACLHFIRNSKTVFEKALVEEDLETIMCLKEILSNNRLKK